MPGYQGGRRPWLRPQAVHSRPENPPHSVVSARLRDRRGAATRTRFGNETRTPVVLSASKNYPNLAVFRAPKPWPVMSYNWQANVPSAIRKIGISARLPQGFPAFLIHFIELYRSLGTMRLWVESCGASAQRIRQDRF
jgi:hypothetical protein